MSTGADAPTRRQKEAKSVKKPSKSDEQVTELIADLQRVRADFENYRKRVEGEKEQAKHSGKTAAVLKLLPTIDNIERAITSAGRAG